MPTDAAHAAMCRTKDRDMEGTSHVREEFRFENAPHLKEKSMKAKRFAETSFLQ